MYTLLTVERVSAILPLPHLSPSYYKFDSQSPLLGQPVVRLFTRFQPRIRATGLAVSRILLLTDMNTKLSRFSLDGGL